MIYDLRFGPAAGRFNGLAARVRMLILPAYGDTNHAVLLSSRRLKYRQQRNGFWRMIE
jgi:hypothetical protein